MKRPANVSFLTEQENQCLELLLQAQDIFDEICDISPQSPTDSFNFGHYLDAARSAVLMRGARRLDPENLLVRHNPFSPTEAPDIEHFDPDDDPGPKVLLCGTENSPNFSSSSQRDPAPALAYSAVATEAPYAAARSTDPGVIVIPDKPMEQSISEGITKNISEIYEKNNMVDHLTRGGES